MCPTTLVDLQQTSCARHAAAPLFGTRGDGGWVWVHYGVFGRMVDRVRAGLHHLGVQPGENVAIIADNGLEWAAACYAVAGLGAALVPLYPAQSAEDWHRILADSEAVLAVVATDPIATALAELELPALRTVVCLEASDHALPWRGLLDHKEPVEARIPDPSEPAAIIYTSGTTGLPKGVVLSHHSLCFQVGALQEVFPLSDQRSLSFLPWAHSFGLVAELHAMVSMGNAIAINDRIPHLLRNLKEVHPTLLVAVPRVYHRIHEAVRTRVAQSPGPVRGLFRVGLDAASRAAAGEELGWFDRIARWIVDRWLFPSIRETLGGRLKTAISGSAALGREVARMLVALGVDVYEGYGLTECGPIATTNRPGAVRLGSVGQALPGVRITIDDGRTADDEDGEIVIHGPNVMLGYRSGGDPARGLTPDGALRTGDLGHLDDDGFLWITGRLTEQFKLENGRFVVPAPVEAALARSPYIAHSLVFGANRPHPVVVIDPDRRAIESWARDQGLQAVDVQTNDRVRALFADELARLTADLKPWERPRGFTIADRPFTPQNGLLTPTQKVRRSRVLSRFQTAIEELYTD